MEGVGTPLGFAPGEMFDRGVVAVRFSGGAPIGAELGVVEVSEDLVDLGALQRSEPGGELPRPVASLTHSHVSCAASAFGSGSGALRIGAADEVVEPPFESVVGECLSVQ